MATEPQPAPAPRRAFHGWSLGSVLSLILIVIATAIFFLLAIKVIDKPDDRATALYWGLTAFAASFFPWPF